jgi:RNA polymerase sigma factor (sigma-70 family)
LSSHFVDTTLAEVSERVDGKICHKISGANVLEVVQPDELAITPFGAGSLTGDWFEPLFRQHYPRIVALLARLTGDRAQAEEIAADTFSKLARRSVLLASREDVTAWIYRVAANAGMDAVRANARRRRKEQAASRERLRMGGEAGALDLLLREEREARVRSILAELKPRDAQILLMRSSGLAYREIAQTLGLAASSVGTVLARAEREFERRFRGRYGDDV